MTLRKLFLVIGCLLFTIQSALAWSWSDLWWRPDQQGAKALQAGQPMAATQLFTTPNWQGVAYYRAGNYEKAYPIFANDHSSQGYYNSGNALANAGKYQAAIDAYNQALKQNPHFSDAQYNKKVVEKRLQQQNQQNQEKQKKQQNQENQQNQKQQQNQQNSSPSLQDKKDNSPSPSNEKNNSQFQHNNQPTQQNKAEQLPANNQSNNQRQSAKKSEQQATEQWLQSIPDDPGGLLQQKFLRDHATYQQLQQQGQQPW